MSYFAPQGAREKDRAIRGPLISRMDNALAALGERATEGKLSDRNKIERLARDSLLIKSSPTNFG